MNILPRRVVAEQFELSPIKAMELAAAKIPGAVSLAQGIPSIGAPLIVKEYAAEMMMAGRCDRYSLTNGLSELREEIAYSLAQEGLHYDPDTEIIVTCGSIEGITAALQAVANPGGEVILPSPTYTSYLGSIALARCTPRFVELDEENNFDFEFEKMAAAITPRTSAILFCSPNNPTGTLYSEETTRRIIELALRHNIPVVVDEVYKDFYYTGQPHFTPAVIPGVREHLIRVCSFSKAFGMTGWRVGFLLAGERNIRKILKYHDAMVTCAPVISQYAAIAALRFGAEFLKEANAIYKRHRDYSIERLDALSQFVDYQVPSATYFVFPRIKDTVPRARNSHALAYDILEKARVALVPGVAFGPSGESHLRINFGREMQDLEVGFDRLTDYFRQSTGSKRIQKTPATPSAPGKPSQAQRGILEQGAVKTLHLAARRHLRRSGARVIGIAGASGKTVLKRTLLDLLSPRYRTRGTILSYNTETGLPLSVLNLTPPKTSNERLLFPIRVLQAALMSSEQLDFLVLEYGINSAADAETLLRIAPPDWLILTGVEQVEPGGSSRELLSGIERLVARVPRNQILWDAGDSVLSQSNLDLPSQGALLPAEGLQAGVMHGAERSYECSKELVGRSSALAALSAVRLAERLGLASSDIEKWLTAP